VGYRHEATRHGGSVRGNGESSGRWLDREPVRGKSHRDPIVRQSCRRRPSLSPCGPCPGWDTHERDSCFDEHPRGRGVSCSIWAGDPLLPGIRSGADRLGKRSLSHRRASGRPPLPMAECPGSCVGLATNSVPVAQWTERRLLTVRARAACHPSREPHRWCGCSSLGSGCRLRRPDGRRSSLSPRPRTRACLDGRLQGRRRR
jgi:hypothetical protein